MIIEIHSHSAEHSPCSAIPAADLIRHCIAKQLHGLVLTDHHYLWPPHELNALIQACAVPRHFTVLSGQEVRTADFGDVLVYGAGCSLPEGTPAAEIVRRFPQAALVLAHPYRSGKVPDARVLTQPLMHAVEIFNSNQSILENIRGLQDWHRLRFAAVGGTDIHGLNYCGTYPTLLDHPVESVHALAHEIRSGRCRPYLSEIPHSGTSHRRVTEVRLGSACRENQAQAGLILKSHQERSAWHWDERTHRIMEAFAGQGFRKGPFRVPVPLGRDERDLVLVEEGVAGQALFDLLVHGPAERTRELLAAAASWLVKLHRCALKVTPAEEFLANEPARLERYLSILHQTGNRLTRRVRQIAERVASYESKWFKDRPDLLVQSHGDFHPKNILIGQEDPHDRDTRFVAAIDFHSSYRLPPAYDVGTFMAQYENQLRSYPQVLQQAPPASFLEAYACAADPLPEAFRIQVELFKARTCLSIIHYLVKVGLGESENVWQVVLAAEKSLIQVRAAEVLEPS